MVKSDTSPFPTFPDGGTAGDPPPEECMVKRDTPPFPTFRDGVKRDALPSPSELLRAGALSKRAPLPLSRAVLSRR